MPAPAATIALVPDRPTRPIYPPHRPAETEPDPYAPFLAHMDTIDELISRTTSSGRWTEADAEDFRSWTYCRLLADDCRILRRCRGRSRMRSYLYVVVSNLRRDFLNSRLGRWRPAITCRRLGRWGVDLDRMVNRDGARGDEAIQVLAGRTDCDLGEPELRGILARVPLRPRWRPVGLEALRHVSAEQESDGRVLALEHVARWQDLLGRLQAALGALDPEDRAILRLRFWTGLSIAQISRRLGLPQKPLYGRLARSLSRLRTLLEARGIKRSEVHSLLVAFAESSGFAPEATVTPIRRAPAPQGARPGSEA